MKISQIIKENEKEFDEKFQEESRGSDGYDLFFCKNIRINYWEMENARPMLKSFLHSSQINLIRGLIGEVEGIKRKFVTQPAEYKKSDANVWREGYNQALQKV